MEIMMTISNLIILTYWQYYISDGKNLNVTMWLASGFENNSASPPEYNQPFRKISYGMYLFYHF